MSLIGKHARVRMKLDHNSIHVGRHFLRFSLLIPLLPSLTSLSLPTSTHFRVHSNIFEYTLLVCDKHWNVWNLRRNGFAVHVILWAFISIISVMRLHNNVVSLVCLLFPHELVHSLLLRRYVDNLNDTCSHCHTMSLIGKHARICWSTTCPPCR